MSHVVNLIIIIAGAIIIFLLLAKLFEATDYVEAINVCRLSVLTQAATELQPTISGKKSPFDIRCEKRYVKFYNTKVELGLSPENMKPMEIDFEGEDVKKFKSLTDHTVNQVIAEELRICKYQFGDGKIAVFGNDERFVLDRRVCYVCTEFSFEPGVSLQKISSLTEYLNKTTFDDAGITYLDYLEEINLYDEYMFRFFKEDDQDTKDHVIDTSKRYAIFIWRFNRGTISGNLEDHVGLFMVPYDRLNAYCDLQAN